MELGMIGIVAASFVALTARKLGHDWGKGAAELGWATMAFVASIVLPSFAALEGERGFVVAGMLSGAIGAFFLYRGAAKTAAP